MLRYKVITLDIYNTLMRVNQSAGQQYSRVALQHGVAVDPHILDKAFHTAFREQQAKHPNYGVRAGMQVSRLRHLISAEKFEKGCLAQFSVVVETITRPGKRPVQRPVTGMSSSAWWSEVVRRTFMTSGYADSQAVVSKIASTLYEDFKTPATWDVFPEVKPTLTSLNKLGACLGVISNCDERLMEVLRATDLAGHFAFVLLSVYTGHEKPRAEMFRMALERLKVSPAECLHVGDSVHQDYRGARAIGMAAVVVDRDGSLAKSHPDLDPDHFVPDLSRLESLLLRSS